MNTTTVSVSVASATRKTSEILPDVAAAVSGVIDVPPPKNMLKILVPNQVSLDGQFHVLNLADRTASPLLTTASDLSLTLSSDGQRAWFFEDGTNELAVVDLDTLHPQNLVLDRPVWDVFDIARSDGGRAMVALHERGTVGATLLDAFSPDGASAVGYVGLLQGGY